MYIVEQGRLGLACFHATMRVCIFKMCLPKMCISTMNSPGVSPKQLNSSIANPLGFVTTPEGWVQILQKHYLGTQTPPDFLHIKHGNTCKISR